MTSLERLVAGLDAAAALLGERALDPDPERNDWREVEGRVRLLESTLRREVLGPLDEALAELQPEHVAGARARVAEDLTAAAGVLLAFGEATSADEFLSRAVQLAEAGERRAVMSAARSDPASFLRLERALFLRGQGRHREAERLLRGLTQSPEPTFQRAARALLEQPRPLGAAPGLFQLNGCGTALFGQAQKRADGSHVATYFLTLLWVPLLPLRAYRVRRLEGSRWQFLAREHLAGWARGWQLTVLVAVLSTAGWAGLRAYLQSPSRLAQLGTEQARSQEAAGQDADALKRYHEVVARHGAQTDVRAAASGVVRLSVKAVHEPCTAEQLGAVGRVVAAFERLPASARKGEPTATLLARLTAWAEQIGAASALKSRAALEVLASAEHLAEPAHKPALRGQLAKLRRSLADELARERPLDALGHYVRLADPPALAAVAGLLERLQGDPALLVEARPDLEAWLKAVGQSHPGAPALRKALERSRADILAQQAHIDQAEPSSLARELKQHPDDQLLALAVARAERAQGHPEACVQVLGHFGGPGRLVGEAQGLLGSCLADLGELEQAQAVLEAYLDEHLSAFQRAQRAYASSREATANRLIEAARRGALPADVNKSLEAAPEAQRGEIFQRWLGAELDKDKQLQTLQAEYLRYRAVAPACLQLGLVELRRSRSASGAQQRARLDAAERVFLAIREEAEGAPDFHLALGQVYHRLGKTAEGDRELGQMLAANDFDLSLQVSEAYRELGLETRTREILEKLYASTSDAERKQAVAYKRAIAPRDLEDQDLWLLRSDQNDSNVRVSRLENEGHRALLAGREQEADRVFAQAAAIYDRNAQHSSAAANNAALDFLARYSATGDPLHRRAALTRLEAALRLAPDSAIVHGNLADALEDAAVVDALAAFVHMRVLRPSGSDAVDLYRALVRGGLRQPLVAALARQASFQRARSVTEQEQALAPRKETAFRRQWRWVDWQDDEAGLRALQAQLELSPLDLSTSLEARQDWLSGRQDTVWRARITQVCTLARQRVERARQDGHKPTLAAALLWLADAELSLGMLAGGPDGFERSVAALREALALWPEAGLEDELADGLLLLAASRAAAESAEWKLRWDAGRRRSSLSWLLHETAQDPGGAVALGAVRARPETAAGLALKTIACTRRPELSHLLFARSLGHAPLSVAGQALASRPEVLPSLKIDLALEPDGVEERGRLAFYQTLRPAGGTTASQP